MKSKHITFLLTQSLQCPSGLGRYWPLARELAKRGYHVEVVALHPNYSSLSPSRRHFRREGVYVHYVWQMHVKKTQYEKSYYPLWALSWHIVQATIRLTWWAAKSKADLFYVGKPHPMNGVAALTQRLIGKTVYVDYDDYESEMNTANTFQKGILRFFEKHLPRIATIITTHTHYMAELLVREWGASPKQVCLIPNGIEDSRFATVDIREVERLRKQLGLEGKQVVLYIGALDFHSHPLDLLLQAFRLVIQHIPAAFLLIVGRGKDFQRTHTLLSAYKLTSNAALLGYIAPERIPLYYHLGQVSVDPVNPDPIASARFPLKVVESFACGIPVITGEIGEREHLIKHYQAGVLVPPGNVEALAEAISNLLQDKEKREYLSEQALRAAQDFRWSKLSERLVAAIEGRERV